MEKVAPHVGAWIETTRTSELFMELMSLPMWERGLKLQSHANLFTVISVAPHVGAWIETRHRRNHRGRA